MSSRAYAMLLAAGADPRVRITGEGSGTISGSALAWTLLSQGLVEKEALSFYAQCALTANDPDLILAAVPQGLDPDLRPYEGTQADSDGETLLHLAAGQGSKGIADALMSPERTPT